MIPNPDYKIPSSVRCNLAFISTENDVDAISQLEKTEYSLSLKMDDLSMQSGSKTAFQSGSKTAFVND